MQHLAGNGAAQVATQIESRLANFLGVDIALERRALGDMMQHGFEIGDPRSRERTNRPGGNRVDPDALGPEIMCQLANARLQSRLRHTHHVVIRNDLLRSHVSERDDGPIATVH